MMGDEWDYLTGEDNSYEAFERWQESILGDDDDDEEELDEDAL